MARLSIVSALLIGALTGLAPHPIVERQDLAAEVKELRTRVEKLEEGARRSEAATKLQDEKIVALQSFVKALPQACQGLDQRMDSARANGFEEAGPNPKAKTDVLEGLKGFAKALNTANPYAPKAEEVEKEDKDAK